MAILKFVMLFIDLVMRFYYVATGKLAFASYPIFNYMVQHL
jgi:hypothetical protein